MRNEYVMCVVVCLTTPVAWIGIGTDIWTRNLCVKTVKALYCKNVSLHIQNSKRSLKCESSLNKHVKKHNEKEYSREQCGKFSRDDI